MGAERDVQKQENNTKEESSTPVDDEMVESKEEIFASVQNSSKTAKQAFRLLKNKCKGLTFSKFEEEYTTFIKHQEQKQDNAAILKAADQKESLSGTENELVDNDDKDDVESLAKLEKIEKELASVLANKQSVGIREKQILRSIKAMIKPL